MFKRTLFTAAVLVALAPALAAAQSAISDPAVPGSGYRIPEVHSATGAVTSADATDLSVPGNGYRITATRSATAPTAPAMTQNGSYPSHFNQ